MHSLGRGEKFSTRLRRFLRCVTSLSEPHNLQLLGFPLWTSSRWCLQNIYSRRHCRRTLYCSQFILVTTILALPYAQCIVQTKSLLGSPPLSSFKVAPFSLREGGKVETLGTRLSKFYRKLFQVCSFSLATIQYVYMKYLQKNHYPNQQWFIRSLELTDRYNQLLLRRNRTVPYSRYGLKLACNRG